MDYRVKSCRIFLVYNDKDSLLLVGGVHGQNHHQHEVRANTADQYWSEKLFNNSC